MTEQSIYNPNDAPEGSNVRIGSRGGMYYTRGQQSSPSSAPKEPTPDETFSGPGYEVLMFKEQNGWRIKYRGPNAQKFINKLTKGSDKTCTQ